METKLPPREAFYSQLNEHELSADDYKVAEETWNTFECKTLKDYHDFYLKLDVTFLADIFENFRAVARSTYGLDPAHYWSLPGYSWDACLKQTKVELELLTEKNAQMYLFIESAIRGGVSMIAHRHAVANNGVGSDITKPASYLAYWDANNLHGWAMSQSLPTGRFRWLDEAEVASFTSEKIVNIADDDDTGYFF